MTKNEFLEAVRFEGIDPNSFKIGDVGNECYVVRVRNGQWDVFYSERGSETGLHQFAEESLALEYLLEWLRSDPTTRQ